MDDRRLREQICEVCRRLWQQGFAAANDGTVSAKLGDGMYLVTPLRQQQERHHPGWAADRGAGRGDPAGPGGTSPLFRDLAASRLLPGTEGCRRGGTRPSPAATGFAVAHQPLDLPGKIEAVLIPCAIPLTEEAPETVRPYLQGYDAFLLANQGALTVGSDVLAAHARMETLEHWARIRLIARMLRGGEDLRPNRWGGCTPCGRAQPCRERPGSPYRAEVVCGGG